jgi:hypothetical protein
MSLSGCLVYILVMYIVDCYVAEFATDIDP